jgi:hypothetical protein
MNDVSKPKRTYRHVTPATVARHKALMAAHGNGTQAVRVAEPSILSPKDRAFYITKKSEVMNTVDFIDEQLQRIGVDAVNRIGRMVNSVNESIATKNAQYVVDHIRGQSVRRSESKHLSLSIEAVLGEEAE